MKFKAPLTLFSILMLAAGSSRVRAVDTVDLSDIVLESHVRIAFYETPASRMQASMAEAVKRECRVTLSSKTRPGWLCSGEALHYVRSVNVLGNRSNTGFVCEGEGSLKYYPPDMFGDESNCLAVCYDGARKNHYVQLQTK